jgi:hypothetical protein
MIYRCRFLAILGVFGSLIGSFLCFIKVPISNFVISMILSDEICQIYCTSQWNVCLNNLVLCTLDSVLLWIMEWIECRGWDSHFVSVSSLLILYWLVRFLEVNSYQLIIINKSTRLGFNQAQIIICYQSLILLDSCRWVILPIQRSRCLGVQSRHWK